MSERLEANLKRRQFAISAGDTMKGKGLDPMMYMHDDKVREAWRQAAREAKTLGIYSRNTYVQDAASGLFGHYKIFSTARAAGGGK